MNGQTLNLRQAAELIHFEENELKHAAQRGELEADEHGGDWWFRLSVLHEWAQRHLLAANRRELADHHQDMIDDRLKAKKGGWSVADLLHRDAVDLELTAKAKGGIIRDMSDLAAKTGLVYDTDGLYRELVEREEVSSTAIGSGAAFLHPRFHDPYLFEETFVAYGRAPKPIFFGAPDGIGTRHFFLICSTDHEAHLRILARLAILAHGSEFIGKLGEAAEASEIAEIIRACESEYQI